MSLIVHLSEMRREPLWWFLTLSGIAQSRKREPNYDNRKLNYLSIIHLPRWVPVMCQERSGHLQGDDLCMPPSLSHYPPSSLLYLPYLLFLTHLLQCKLDSAICLSYGVLEYLGQIKGYFYYTLESIAYCCHLCVRYDAYICDGLLFWLSVIL